MGRAVAQWSEELRRRSGGTLLQFIVDLRGNQANREQLQEGQPTTKSSLRSAGKPLCSNVVMPLQFVETLLKPL